MHYNPHNVWFFTKYMLYLLDKISLAWIKISSDMDIDELDFICNDETDQIRRTCLLTYSSTDMERFLA